MPSVTAAEPSRTVAVPAASPSWKPESYSSRQRRSRGRGSQWGHSLAGYGATEGGVLIDLSAMHAIHIDAAALVATVEAGATAGQLTAAAAHDLVVPFGDSPTVGVGGITLGGGVGWLSRKLGLTIDSVEGVEIVTADGRPLTADEHTRPDLFWAVRGGGGGNFGVVTRFRYRLHPIGAVLGGALFLPATARSSEAWSAWPRLRRTS
jgi:FAD/FMN-containing dehydrogenase